MREINKVCSFVDNFAKTKSNFHICIDTKYLANPKLKNV